MCKEEVNEIQKLLSTAHELCLWADKFNRIPMMQELMNIINSCVYSKNEVKSDYLFGITIPEEISCDYAGDKIRLAFLYKKAMSLVKTEEDVSIFEGKANDSKYILKVQLNEDKTKKYTYPEVLIGVQIADEMKYDCDSNYINMSINKSELDAMKKGFLYSMRYTFEHWNSPESEKLYKKIKQSIKDDFNTLDDFEKYKHKFSQHYVNLIKKHLKIYNGRIEYYRNLGVI